MDGEQNRIEKQAIIGRLNAIYEQIKTNPTPITGCDEYVSYLLSGTKPTTGNDRTTIRLP